MTSSEKALAAICVVFVSLIIGFVSGIWVAHSIADRAEIAAMKGAATEIAKIQIKHETITQPVLERVRTEVQYRECKHDPDTFKLIQEAFKP